MTNKSELYKDTTCNAIILAGGNSSRMNYPKAWLPFENEISILEHLIDIYHTIGCQQIVVVLNNNFIQGYDTHINKIRDKVLIVPNSDPDKGRIYSLKLAISQMKREGVTFIQNVDNPFIGTSLLNELLNKKPMGYVRPIVNYKGAHPILVTNGVLENISLSSDNCLLHDILDEHHCMDHHVDNDKILCNINTAEDYRTHFGREVPETKHSDHAKRA